jgi:hypothetical protein
MVDQGRIGASKKIMTDGFKPATLVPAQAKASEFATAPNLIANTTASDARCAASSAGLLFHTAFAHGRSGHPDGIRRASIARRIGHRDRKHQDRGTSVFNWREHLEIHPAAELFRLMSPAELKELADDIKKNGLHTPIVMWETDDPDDPDHPDYYLLDGRNRLDAMALAGLLDVDGYKLFELKHSATFLKRAALRNSRGPYAAALSLNVHRRHLTADQKRDLIAKVLKAKPEDSNRQIASAVKVDHKTVGAVRSEMEGRGEIPHVEKRADTKGRKQPASKTVKVRVAGETLKSLDGFSDAAKQQIADAIGVAKEPDTTAEESAADTAQDFWQRSLGNLAGDSISMEAFWKRQFGDWEKFEVTSDLVTLAEQAAEAWNKVAAKLKKPKAVAGKVAA